MKYVGTAGAASAAPGASRPGALPATPTEADRGERTRGRVARSLLEGGPSTAAVIGQRLGLTPAAVRRHLDALLADGLVEAREPSVRAPRGRGRPAKVLLLTEHGRDAFFQAYDDLAAAAMRFLAEQGGAEAVAAFTRTRVADLESRYRPAVSAAPPQQRAAALAQALSADGYAATARDARAGGVQLCQHHCPVAHVAEQFPQLCEAETDVFARLLGTHVQRLATIAHGDGVCTTHIPPVPTSRQVPSSWQVPSTATPRRSEA